MMMDGIEHNLRDLRSRTVVEKDEVSPVLRAGKDSEPRRWKLGIACQCA